MKKNLKYKSCFFFKQWMKNWKLKLCLDYIFFYKCGRKILCKFFTIGFEILQFFYDCINHVRIFFSACIFMAIFLWLYLAITWWFRGHLWYPAYPIFLCFFFPHYTLYYFHASNNNFLFFNNKNYSPKFFFIHLKLFDFFSVHYKTLMNTKLYYFMFKTF